MHSLAILGLYGKKTKTEKVLLCTCLVVCGVGSSIAYVFHDGGGKQNGLLADVSDGGTPEPFGIQITNVDAVQVDSSAALGAVVKALHQGSYGGLASAA